MSEHLAHSIMLGEFYEVDATGIKEGAYRGYRTLMDTVLCIISGEKSGNEYNEWMRKLIDAYVVPEKRDGILAEFSQMLTVNTGLDVTDSMGWVSKEIESEIDDLECQGVNRIKGRNFASINVAHFLLQQTVRT